MADPVTRIDAAIDRIIAAAGACIDDVEALRLRHAALRGAVAEAVAALDAQLADRARVAKDR